MQCFKNRTAQLETKPKNRISENSVQPQEDEGKSPKATHGHGLDYWILIETKNLISTNISDQKLGVTPDSAPRILFGAPTNPVVFPMAGPHALSQLNSNRDKIFGFSVSKNFQGASGATTSAVNDFKFGATANMNAPQESSPVSYSDDAAYRQYLRRVLDTTLNQGLINHHNHGVASVHVGWRQNPQRLWKVPRNSSWPPEIPMKPLFSNTCSESLRQLRARVCTCKTTREEVVSQLQRCFLAIPKENRIVVFLRQVTPRDWSRFPARPGDKTPYPRGMGHPDWATLRESIIAGATAAARYGYSWDEAAHVKHVTSIWEHNRFLAAEKLNPPLLWTARLTDIWITTSEYTADIVTSPRRHAGNLGAPLIKRPWLNRFWRSCRSPKWDRWGCPNN